MRGRRRPAHWILDSLPAHKTVAVRDYVARTKGKLTLHFLPGYATDLNPDELGWSHVPDGVCRMGSPIGRPEAGLACCHGSISSR
jgi:hypothetical protein